VSELPPAPGLPPPSGLPPPPASGELFFSSYLKKFYNNLKHFFKFNCKPSGLGAPAPASSGETAGEFSNKIFLIIFKISFINKK
jgi:hypothetical protein